MCATCGKSDAAASDERIEHETSGKASAYDAFSKEFTEKDVCWMRLALAEAQKAKRISPPNPSVGAVIVRDGRLLGAGFTQQTGGPHAEVMAMRDVEARGETVEGATVYVTLEPCSHYGRTPPCALALIEHRAARVVVAMGDPNPKVAGRGLRMLEEAGIAVTFGVLSDEAYETNLGFMTRMTRGTPWVRLKAATTLDGFIALSDGRSQWITGEAARADGHAWRAVAGAVLTGIGTVLADDPQMNVRLPGETVPRQPLRVVVDRHLETPTDAKLLTSPGGRVLIVTTSEGASHLARRSALEAAGAEVIVLDDAERVGYVDLGRLLIELAKREVNEVHVEAGAGLSGALLSAGLVDELLWYVAPCVFGAGLSPLRLAPPASPGAAPRWRVRETAPLGGDIRIICRRN